jgi:hypothetical protein
MKAIVELLIELENGQFEEDVNRQLRKVVAAVMETGRPGGIKLALTITPTGRASVKVTGAVAAKEPEHPRDATTFFVSDDNELQRDDPAQLQMPLREVRQPDGDLRVVGGRGVEAAE